MTFYDKNGGMHESAWQMHQANREIEYQKSGPRDSSMMDLAPYVLIFLILAATGTIDFLFDKYLVSRNIAFTLLLLVIIWYYTEYKKYKTIYFSGLRRIMIISMFVLGLVSSIGKSNHIEAIISKEMNGKYITNRKNEYISISGNEIEYKLKDKPIHKSRINYNDIQYKSTIPMNNNGDYITIKVSQTRDTLTDNKGNIFIKK
jgi:hypothetical protein